MVETSKPFSATEIQAFCLWSQDLLRGAQLQDIRIQGDLLSLTFWFKGPWTLYLDLQAGRPWMALLPQDSHLSKKISKPITLFLKAHFENRLLERIYPILELGRVFEVSFGDSLCLQIHLLPKTPNLIAIANEKKLSVHPVRELPPHQEPIEVQNLRTDFAHLSQSWFELKFKKTPSSQGAIVASDEQKKKQKALEKKRTAVQKIEENLLQLENENWGELGELLKTSQSFDVDHPLVAVLDKRKTLAENIQMCFLKHKDQKRKRQGALERLSLLKKEMAGLESRPLQKEPQVSPHLSISATQLMRKAKAQGRKWVVDEHLEAVYGKSAADNLALLRHAQKWDLWMHLRDYPSSHLIIRRPRDFQVSTKILNQIADWFISEALPAKGFKEGDVFDLVITECRFVKPLKGDKMGRVTYSNEHRLRHAWHSRSLLKKN